jgi:hypothetical protein
MILSVGYYSALQGIYPNNTPDWVVLLIAVVSLIGLFILRRRDRRK